MIGNPNLKHSEINLLYENDFSIEKTDLEKILALPRESLVADLEEVLNEAIRNYENYDTEYEEEPEEATFLAPAHAIFLLGELAAVEALPTIENFLSQNFERLDFWLGDLLTEELWAPIYKIASDNIAILFPYLKKNAIDEFANHAHLAAATIHFVRHREDSKLLAQYRILIDDLTKAANRTSGQSREVQNLSYLIWELIDVRAVELLPEIKQALKTDKVIEYGIEEWQEVEDALRSPIEKTTNIPTLIEQYQKISKWFSSTEVADYGTIGFGGSEVASEAFWQEKERQKKLEGTTFHSGTTPFERETRKIGRNDLCPCGSGKKYKKCCLKK